MLNGTSNGWTWARLLIEIVGKADSRMGHYEPTYRTWLAKLVTPPYVSVTLSAYSGIEANQSTNLTGHRSIASKEFQRLRR